MTLPSFCWSPHRGIAYLQERPRILSMRFVPRCGEGWRRLSLIVLTIVTICSFVWLVGRYNAALADNATFCRNVVTEGRKLCTRADNVMSCLHNYGEISADCDERANPPIGRRIPSWTFRLIYAALIGYMSLLLVRSIGWVTGGFRPASSTLS
jgi:hypothetical protein